MKGIEEKWGKKMNEFYRNCPICNKELIMSGKDKKNVKWRWKRAIKNKIPCNSCSIKLGGKLKGDNNPAKRLDVRKKISENNAMKNPENVEKVRQMALRPEERKRRSIQLKNNNPAHNLEFLQKRINTYTKRLANGEYNTKSCFKTGYYEKKNGQKEWYDSSLELKRMEQLDQSGVSWTKKHKIRIPYKNENGINTYYVPDFLIENNIIEEVKGWLKGNDEMKAELGITYCKENGMKYIFMLGDKLDIVENLSWR